MRVKIIKFTFIHNGKTYKQGEELEISKEYFRKDIMEIVEEASQDNSGSFDIKKVKNDDLIKFGAENEVEFTKETKAEMIEALTEKFETEEALIEALKEWTLNN